MKKYKISREEGQGLLQAKSVINTIIGDKADYGRVYDVCTNKKEVYVIIYKMDIFFEAMEKVATIFKGLNRKFDYDKPLYGSKPVTGDEFIF